VKQADLNAILRHERSANDGDALLAVTEERDSLRREVAALVIHTARLGCPRCAEFVKKCPVKKAEDYGKEACRECWAAWAKQQAAQAGKDTP
jgi:hypothetical protein